MVAHIIQSHYFAMQYFGKLALTDLHIQIKLKKLRHTNSGTKETDFQLLPLLCNLL